MWFWCTQNLKVSSLIRTFDVESLQCVKQLEVWNHMWMKLPYMTSLYAMTRSLNSKKQTIECYLCREQTTVEESQKVVNSIIINDNAHRPSMLKFEIYSWSNSYNIKKKENFRIFFSIKVLFIWRSFFIHNDSNYLIYIKGRYTLIKDKTFYGGF